MTTIFPYLHILLSLLLLLSNKVSSVDVFCGTLTIFEQQRFGANSNAISSQETADLKQCLELCCGIIACRGVTFNGIISSQGKDPNCQLIGCRGKCELNPPAEYQDGVLSVILERATQSQQEDLLLNVSTARPYSSSSSEDVRKSGSLAPVWSVGIAIVVAVVCVGLSLGFLSAYICYRRRKSKMQSAQISTAKGPTLHAYNPTL